MGTTLFQHGQTLLEVNTHASEDTISLLKNTIWGSPGKTQYQRLQSEEKIRRMRDAQFITLRRFKRLLGNISFCRRPLWNSGWKCNGMFIRYFSLPPALENIRHPRLPKQQISVQSNWAIGNSLLKSTVDNYMASKIAGTKKTLIYAYVESDNTLSKRMSQAFGFTPIGSFETLVFNRLCPKKCDKITLASHRDKEQVQKLLERQYETYNLFSLKKVMSRNTFYVYKEKNEILACVQAFPIKWKICNMPGRSGELLVKILPKLPFAKRFFNPAHYAFIALEALCITPGAEDILPRLFESICAMNNVYSAMIWVDIHSPLAATIKTRCRLGILNALNGAPPADIIVKGYNISPIELRSLKSNNSYISAWDIV